MSRVRFRLLILAALLLAAVRAPGAVLIHEYALRGSLNDNLGGPSLVALGGEITALGYAFAMNHGLTLESAALSATSFSIELSFNFDATSGYRKIADFHNRADDSGFYVYHNALNFYPVTTAEIADISAESNVHVVLTRDGATNAVKGYVNGNLRFSFEDTAPHATLTAPSQKLIFFADDFATGEGESSSGKANFIRIYNGAMTAGEVSAAFAAGAPLAVPEPGTWALLGLGGIGVLATRRRRGAPNRDA